MQVQSSSPVPAVFSFESLDVRVVDRDGEPWFVAADVTAALSFSRPQDALRMVDEDDKCLISLKGALSAGLEVGPRGVLLVNESGVYQIIFQSNKPEAKKFKKWVTSEVLPAIRKTGSYSAAPLQHFSVPVEANRVFESFHSLALKIGFEGNQAVLSANMATRQLTGVDPLHLMGATHLLAGNQNRHYTPTELGERFHMTGREMNIALEAAGLQTRHGKQWMPTVKGRAYAVLLDTTKRRGEGTPIQQLKWTADVLDAMPTLAGGAA